MAVRGEYSEPERAMLAATNELMDQMVGWVRPTEKMVATEESIRAVAASTDRWNPLWRDAEYARGTRWGDVIAHPFYIDRFGMRGIGVMPASPECGYQDMIWVGEDWEFHRPVQVGDVFKVWRRRPWFKDVTPLDGTGPRIFGLVETDQDFVTRDDELVANSQTFVQRTFLPEPPQPRGMPEYSYSREELEWIASVIRQEQVRGGNCRYWEEVDEGEETRPVVLGPTSMADNAASNAASPDFLMLMTSRDTFLAAAAGEENGEFILDSQTGRYHIRGGPAGRHWSEHAARAEGVPHAFLFGVLSRHLLCRCVTNWMGDDGFLTALRWRHITRTPVGDTLVARARVTGKRTDGEAHLIDLVVWNQNLRGFVSEAATATVRLPSRTRPVEWRAAR